jgi:hypothetical protein
MLEWPHDDRHRRRDPDGPRRAARYADALALPHVRPMDFTGKPMKGYVYVDPLGIEADAALEQLDHGLLGLRCHLAAEGSSGASPMSRLRAATFSRICP